MKVILDEHDVAVDSVNLHNVGPVSTEKLTIPPAVPGSPVSDNVIVEPSAFVVAEVDPVILALQDAEAFVTVKPTWLIDVPVL